MRSRSDDPVAAALTDAAELITAAVRACEAQHPVVLIDGRSGAGKTTLSRAVAAAWPRDVAPQLIPLDALYPGWHGLDAGVERAVDGILRPHRDGVIGTWRGWDWDLDRDADAHASRPDAGVILEGCGAITPTTAPLADVRVWVEAPADARYQRAMTRSGDGFRPWWDMWAEQEDRHIARDDPRALATLVIDVP